MELEGGHSFVNSSTVRLGWLRNSSVRSVVRSLRKRPMQRDLYARIARKEEKFGWSVLCHILLFWDGSIFPFLSFFLRFPNRRLIGVGVEENWRECFSTFSPKATIQASSERFLSVVLCKRKMQLAAQYFLVPN